MKFKILFIFLIMLLFFPLITSWEIDNVKNYNPTTKTATITNAFGLGSDIAEVKLETPNIVWVDTGYQKVAEFDINNFDNGYNFPIDLIESYNIKQNNKRFARSYDYKYWIKTGEHTEYVNTQTGCSLFSVNGTCTNPLFKKEISRVVEEGYWEIFDNTKDLSVGKIKISLWTNVNEGDYIEWVPTLFGVKINEWAVYGAVKTVIHGQTSKSAGGTGGTCDSLYTGVVINATRNINITGFEYIDGGLGGCTACYILNLSSTADCSSPVVVATGSIVDGKCVFTTGYEAIKGHTYVIAGLDKGSATDYYSGVTYPIVNESFSWVKGFGSSTCYNTELFMVDNISIQDATGAPSSMEISLDIPADSFISSNSTILFNSTITPTNLNITNGTLFIWDSDNNIFNQTTNSVTGNETNSTTWIVYNFTIGTYKWNVLGCGINSTSDTFCFFSTDNYTLTLGSSTQSQYYPNETYETAEAKFNITIELLEGAEISLAQLVYNGTNYTISDITGNSTVKTLSKTINIPLNLNQYQNDTKTFFYRFTYGGISVQETDITNHTVSFINLQNCNATYPTQTLNFTMYDELSQSNIVSATNLTNFESFFSYWVGSGSVVKNYSFQNLSSAVNNYQFCIYPYNLNTTYKVNNDIIYSALEYRENQYHLRNATITNVSNDILLYLMQSAEATKFFLTFKQGVNYISGATVNVQKYFTGLGTYITVGILETDTDGKTTMWMDLDKQYKFSVVKNGQLLGSVEKIASCSVAPCTMTITLESAESDLFESYYNEYATGVLSNISFNKATKMVTYNFIDVTGLANYFRLEVKEVILNSSKNTVCNVQSYSVAGSLSCNLSNYSNSEFIATGYISRSPEKVDAVLNVLIDEDIIEGIGLMGVLLVMGLIITIVFAAAVITKGSPSGVLISLAFAVIVLKLTKLFPFSWGVVIPLELLILYMITKVKV